MPGHGGSAEGLIIEDSWSKLRMCLMRERKALSLVLSRMVLLRNTEAGFPAARCTPNDRAAPGRRPIVLSKHRP